MLGNIFGGLKWSLSIGAKLTRIVPIYTLVVVIATLCSQISLLLTFFLPLKVIILLGSPGIPQYFPASWQSLDRDYLVISLAASAVGFYLMYLFAERLTSFCSAQGARRLIVKSKKITLFHNQDELALWAYQRYTHSLAGAVFVSLALIATGALYPPLVLVVIYYMLTVFLLLLMGFTYSQSIRSIINQNTKSFGSIIGAIGFLLAFMYMVLDFLKAPTPGVTEAVISLLLVRQLMNRVVGSLTDLSVLHDQRLQINALFFHGKPLVPGLSQREQKFWPLLESPRRDEWISDVLRDIAELDPRRLDCAWHQTGVADVVAFEVTASNYQGLSTRRYLVKLFNNNRKALARHEASLLAECATECLPALQLLGVDSVRGYPCSIFRWEGGQIISAHQIKSMRLNMLNRLIAYEPAGQLVEQFGRSRPMLAQRLDDSMVDRLRLIVGNSKTLEEFEGFKRHLDNLQARLEALPVQIVNPDITHDTLLITENNKLILTHWGKWSIEPIGAGWPVQEKDLGKLDEALISARKYRPALADVSVKDVRMAALMFAFEQFYNKQKYTEALGLLPSMISCIERSDINTDIERG
jgi:hypothetical protein